MLLSEEEAKIKAQLWYSENADFLKEQEGTLGRFLLCACVCMRLACDLKTLCSVKREKLAALEAAKADKPKKVTTIVILVACIAIVSCNFNNDGHVVRNTTRGRPG